jgi:hypothetical protein
MHIISEGVLASVLFESFTKLKVIYRYIIPVIAESSRG